MTSGATQRQALVAKMRSGDEPVLVAKPHDVHEPQRRGGGGLARYYKVDGGRHARGAWTKWRCRSGGCGRGASGGAGGHNGLKSIIAAARHRRVAAACGWAWGAATRGGTSRITCSSTFEPDEREQVEAAMLRAADAAEMFAAEGIGA